MQSKRFVRSLVVQAALLALFFVAAPRADAQSKLEEFRAKVAELKVGDADGLAKLVKTYPAEAEQHAVELCYGFRALTPEQKKQIGALDAAWQANYAKANFVNKLFGYYSQLGERTWKDWRLAKTGLDDAQKAFDANLNGPRDHGTWNDLGERCEALGKSFDELGDHYHAARAYGLAANALDDLHRDKTKSDADLVRAAKDYEEARRHYLYVEFTGAGFEQVKTRLAQLGPKAADDSKPKGGAPAGGDKAPPPKAGGDGGGEKGGGDKGGGQEPAAAPASATTIAMTFQAVEKLDAYERPHFHVDDIYQLWRPLGFGKNGSEVGLDMVVPSPKFRRVTAATFEIDQDLDGKFEKQVSITGNRQIVPLTVGTGETKREWAFLFTIGIEKDTYQGLQVHLGPVDASLRLYTAGAASMVGKFGDLDLRVIDDDQNAVYGNWPQTWGYGGLTAGTFQPEMDCLVVGAEKRARPWSEFQNLAGKWHKFTNAKYGTELTVTPADVVTGTVKLDFKGPVWPTWLVLKGAGRYENTYLDLAADGKKGVAVPVGEWTLYYGELRKGSKQQTMKCLILPRSEPRTWGVDGGKETVIKLGEPFQFDFHFENLGDNVKVTGESVAILGKDGERYERMWNCVSAPEVEWRKAGVKKGSKAEKMEHLQDPNSQHVFEWSWKPLDLLIPTKEKVEKIEVHLFEKKHKFLGAIDSPWKGE
ncbi:MAG: hypothetical protein K8S98_12970 [Planctomycetes bacterium]|nr:hypothetical protein [Planctomycetota bacterium]